MKERIATSVSKKGRPVSQSAVTTRANQNEGKRHKGADKDKEASCQACSARKIVPLELFSIVYKCIPGFLFFALLRYVIGLELTRVTISTNRIQNLNQRATWSFAFSRASGNFLAFSSSSHRLLVIFLFL